MELLGSRAAERQMRRKLRKLREAIDCPVCLERYREPKMLPCQHTFCRHCIHRIVEVPTVGNEPGRIPTVACPLCRATTSYPAAVTADDVARSLPNNVYVGLIIDSILTTLDDDDDDDDEARSGCCICRSNPTIYCSDPGCLIPVCARCAETRHNRHTRLGLSEAAASSRSRLLGVEAALLGRRSRLTAAVEDVRRRAEGVDASARFAEKEIVARADELHQAVDAAAAEMMHQVDEKRSTGRQQLEDCRSRLMDEVAGLDELEQSCRRVLDDADEPEVVRQTTELVRKVDDALRTGKGSRPETASDDCGVDVPDNLHVRFDSPSGFEYQPYLLDLISNIFGTVSVTVEPAEVDVREDSQNADVDLVDGSVVDPTYSANPPTDAEANDDRSTSDRSDSIADSSEIVSAASGRKTSTSPPGQFNVNCAVVVHGILTHADWTDVDIFIDFCSEHLAFIPKLVRCMCRRLESRRGGTGKGRRRGPVSPLLIVCQNEADAQRLLAANKDKTVRSKHVNIVPYRQK